MPTEKSNDAEMEKRNPPGGHARTGREERRYREGFCHGVAGVQHLIEKLDEQGADPDPRRVMRVYLEVTGEFRDDGKKHGWYKHEVMSETAERLGYFPDLSAAGSGVQV